ncbi:MAG: hypothetical protein WCO60_00940 [Verrucomicrobiota bacterium]
MESARYFIAVALTAVLPSLLLFWVIIHVSAIYWRHANGAVVFAIALLVFLAGMATVVSQREWLFKTDWGSSPTSIACGTVFLGVGIFLRASIRRTFTTRQLVGIPEIKSTQEQGNRRLNKNGIYSRVRHRRDVQLVIMASGYAMLANFPTAYVALAAFVPGIYIVVLLEEIELRERFGSRRSAKRFSQNHASRFVRPNWAPNRRQNLSTRVRAHFSARLTATLW